MYGASPYGYQPYGQAGAAAPMYGALLGPPPTTGGPQNQYDSSRTQMPYQQPAPAYQQSPVAQAYQQPQAAQAYQQPQAAQAYQHPPATPYQQQQQPAPYQQQPPAQQQPYTTNTYGQLPPGSFTFSGPAMPQQTYHAPQPAYQAPTTYAPAPPASLGKRRALLVGCSYPGTQAQLNGCINDVNCIKYCLTKNFGFPEAAVVLLRDDQRGGNPDFVSTRANIMRGMQWLLMGVQAGDSLFFHFSGHGSQKPDQDGDEEDGYDETLVPSDYKTAGEIRDDDVNTALVRPLPTGARLHAIIDACHSGTALDLPFRVKVKPNVGFKWKGRDDPRKRTAGGLAVQFGACTDSQVAQDTNRLSGGVHTGAATYCFIDAIEKSLRSTNMHPTYAELLNNMHHALQQMTKQSGGNSPAPMAGAMALVAGLLLGGPISFDRSQTPVMSCDRMLDLKQERLYI